MLETLPTVRDLRSQWKPHKARLGSHPTAVRFHRACSWLDRAEKLDPATDADLVLVSQWIALNCLYGRWNGATKEPCPDRESWKSFFDRVLAIDDEALIGNAMQHHRPLVLTILEDEYLSSFFWRDPSPQSKQAARNHRRKAEGLYFERNWTLLLDRLLERVYLLRCQLIHGASTFGGQLNRTSLKRVTQLLRQLLPVVLVVIIRKGADEDWGPLCYPPMRGGPVAPNMNGNGVKPR